MEKRALTEHRAPSCPKCGALIFPEGSEGFCGACLLETALEAEASTNEVLLDFGDYELLEEIGRSGQGVVYRARQKGLNRIVALKVIGLGHWATEAHLRRFRTEAEAAAQLDHPSIVPIYDIGERDGACYFSMKLVEGGQLDELVRCRPLSIREAAQLIAKVARTLHYAHERGVLHRDVKPGNILLDKRGEPHLTDFGLARLVEKESNVTRTMDVLGTPSYMAPEQAAGANENLTSATDIYGLGAVFYHLLSGQPPFAGGTTYETIKMVLEKEPRNPRLWNARIDRDVATICLKCLEKDPSRRYASALQLAEDLERWLKHEPIRARRAGMLVRSRKWIRREPRVAILAGASVLLVGVVIFFWRGRDSFVPREDSIAVVIRSADTESASFAHEYSRQLNDLFTRVSSFKAAPRAEMLKWETSGFSGNEIAKSLHQKLLLLGTVRRIEDAFEADCELYDVDDHRVHWSRKYSGHEADAPLLEAQMVREVASVCGIRLTDHEQSLLRRPLSSNQDALREYFAGRRADDVNSEASLREAITHFQKATEIDPQFAQAYAGLASAHIALGYTFANPGDHFRAARVSLDGAMKLDPTLTEARIADGLLKYFYDWDWRGASAALDEALRLDPSFVEADACYLHSSELLQQDDSLAKVRQAAALHPSSVAIRTELGCAAYYAGHLAESIDFYNELLKINPDDPILYWGMARAQAQQGNLDEALLTVKKAQTEPGGNWSAIDAEEGYILA